MPSVLEDLSTTAALRVLGSGRELVLDRILGEAQAHAVRAAALFLDDGGGLCPACVGPDRQRLPGIRGDRMMWLERESVEPALQDVIDLMDAGRVILNEQAYLGAGQLEVQLSIYEPGHGYSRHRDTMQGRQERRLTAIYYANDWRPGDGGELALYDEYGGCDRLIEPVSDRLVLFLADTPHAVLPVVRGRRVAVTAFMRR